MAKNNYQAGMTDGMRWFMGIVEDRGTGQFSGKKDNTKLGRCKVRIYGMHGEEVKTADLPWAHVATPAQSAGISGVGRSPTGLVEGSKVVGFFVDGTDGQEPIILCTLPHVQQKKNDRGEKTVK